MRKKFRLGIMISVFVALATVACAMLFAGPTNPSRMEGTGIPALTEVEIRDSETALKYGATGYLEITYPSDSPSLLSIDRGGEININILLHFVSHTPELTELQVNIDPKSRGGLSISYRDVNFREFVSYNPSGNITIKAGETIPVIMSIRIPENLSSYIEAIPLGAMGIQANVTIIDELREKEVAIHE